MFKKIYSTLFSSYKTLVFNIITILFIIFYFTYDLNNFSYLVLLICILFIFISIYCDYILIKNLINQKFIKLTRSQFISELVISIGWVLLLSLLYNFFFYSPEIPITLKHINKFLIFTYTIYIFLLLFYKKFIDIKKNNI